MGSAVVRAATIAVTGRNYRTDHHSLEQVTDEKTYYWIVERGGYVERSCRMRRYRLNVDASAGHAHVGAIAAQFATTRYGNVYDCCAGCDGDIVVVAARDVRLTEHRIAARLGNASRR
jgi:hypothetical protein